MPVTRLVAPGPEVAMQTPTFPVARATGKVGVCIATSGPGATNLVTGIATSYLDSSPVVAITGQVPSHLIGTDAFQEADVFGLSFPITKHSYLVRRTVDIPRV